MGIEIDHTKYLTLLKILEGMAYEYKLAKEKLRKAESELAQRKEHVEKTLEDLREEILGDS